MRRDGSSCGTTGRFTFSDRHRSRPPSRPAHRWRALTWSVKIGLPRRSWPISAPGPIGWTCRPTPDGGRHEHQLPNGQWILIFDRDLPDGWTVRTLTDITARRLQEAGVLKAKETAEATRARMQAILQSLQIGVLVANEDLATDFWNDAYVIYSGLSDQVLSEHRGFEESARYIYDT